MNLFNEYGLSKLINALGPSTFVGTSRVSKEVIACMESVLTEAVDMRQLQELGIVLPQGTLGKGGEGIMQAILRIIQHPQAFFMNLLFGLQLQFQPLQLTAPTLQNDRHEAKTPCGSLVGESEWEALFGQAEQAQ